MTQLIIPNLYTAPTIEPITLEEAKEHLRVTDTSEDGYIDSLIRAARQMCEADQDRTYIRTSWKVTLDRIPSSCAVLVLPRPPLISVTSFAYVDSSGSSTTLSSSNYTVDIESTPGRLLPAYNYTWPDTRDHPGSVTIIYRAGYGTTTDSIPMSIKQAILLLVGHLFENREPVNIGNIVNPLPWTVSALLDVERWSVKHG